MKINNKLHFTLLFLVVLNAHATIKYIPSNYEQFENTGICINCDLSEASFIFHKHNGGNLEGSLLVKSEFDNAAFNSFNFNNTQLMYANLSWVQASGSQFKNADLTGADMSYGNFSSSDFSGANMKGADLRKSDLVRAIISNEQLQSVKSLSCAILPDGTQHVPDSGTTC